MFTNEVKLHKYFLYMCLSICFFFSVIDEILISSDESSSRRSNSGEVGRILKNSPPPIPKAISLDRTEVFATVLFTEFLKELAAIAQEHSILSYIPMEEWSHLKGPSKTLLWWYFFVLFRQYLTKKPFISSALHSLFLKNNGVFIFQEKIISFTWLQINLSSFVSGVGSHHGGRNSQSESTSFTFTSW